MIFKFKFFALVGILLCLMSESFAQDGVTPIENPVIAATQDDAHNGRTDELIEGRAYELSGLARYVTFPAKVIFGDTSLAGTRIRVGFRVSPSAAAAIDRQHCRDFLILQNQTNSWWQQPYYAPIDSPIDLALSNEGSAPNNEGFIILPRSPDYNSTIETCLANDVPVDSVELLVDESIVQGLSLATENREQ